MIRTLSLLVALSALLWSIRPMPSSAQIGDSHAEHDPAAHDDDDHAGHADDEAEAHDDDHAGHADDGAEAHDTDHAGHETEEAVPAADPHAGHDHGVPPAEETDPHAGHDHAAEPEEESGPYAGHEDEGMTLSPEQHERFGIHTAAAGPGSLHNEVTLPGEILFNEDRVVHLVPRVPGIVLGVEKSVGDWVQPGDLLAVLDSRELADAKAGYLAARARTELSETTFAREQALRESQISSEQEFLDAKQRLAETRIALRSAEQKLHALGLSEEDLLLLDQERNEAITRYEVRSPIHGMVTEKHISHGESLADRADIFTIVDLSSVWVNLTVYTKNLAGVRAGQDVVLRVDHSGAQTRGTIDMVTPFVEEATRSATARVVLDNQDKRWIPGTFVTGFIRVSDEDLPVVVPLHAVQNIAGRDVVFVEHEGAFEITPVTTGRSDRESIEILTGLKAGTTYVTDGAFELKATVITSNLDSHAGHGH